MGISTSCFRHIFGNKEVRILMHGLHATGKTTMLYMLKLGEIVPTIPTIGFNVETIQHKNVSLTTWDIGGRDKIRPLWRYYYVNADACIFVVDSNDQERFEELREEIFRVLSEDELRDVVVLIFANKQDLPNALGKEKIVEALRLKEIKQTWHIEETSIKSTTGIYEGLDWLVAQLNGSTGSAGGKTQSAWSHLLSPFSWLPSWRKEAVNSTLPT